MSATTLWLFAILAPFALLPVLWAWRLVFFYWRHSGPTRVADDALPRAQVILSLRGADPSLVHCLDGLLRQDYPHFRLHIVVDSKDDPAWKVVEDTLAKGHGNVQVKVEVLRDRLETCSLKVSSQLQAIAELPEDVEVVAFIDADSIPATDWLRALAAPLGERGVGVTTGIRWFAPRDGHWGSYLRHLYNAGSFPQMYVFQMPWGGSFAVRKETLLRVKMPEHWASCFCEDISASVPLRRAGLSVRFVPAATQINPESVEMKGAGRFIVRQLLCVRLNFAAFGALLFVNLANAVSVTAAAALLVAGLFLDDFEWAATFGGLLGGFVVGLLSALITGELLIRRNMRPRVADVPPFVWSWKIVPAALLAQVLSMHYLIGTMTLKQVDWRGVSYAIEGRDKIRLLEYQPFRAPALDPSRSVV